MLNEYSLLSFLNGHKFAYLENVSPYTTIRETKEKIKKVHGSKINIIMYNENSNIKMILDDNKTLADYGVVNYQRLFVDKKKY